MAVTAPAAYLPSSTAAQSANLVKYVKQLQPIGNLKAVKSTRYRSKTYHN